MLGIEFRDRMGDIWPEDVQLCDNDATSIYGDADDASDEECSSTGVGDSIDANNETNGDSEQKEVHEDHADPDDFADNKDAILLPECFNIVECDQTHAEIAEVPGSEEQQTSR